MSRQLPARPSLEHLKKQAKDRLEELRRLDPSVPLADAQHALAREYGFASWPKLKAHVDEILTADGEVWNPFAGSWIVNVAMSRRHPANEFHSATIVFDVDGADVRITDVVVDAAGREERHMNAIRADGLEHLSESGDGYSLVATWRNSHTLEAVGRKEGTVIGTATYAVSPDGRTLTIASDQQYIVLDRGAAPADL